MSRAWGMTAGLGLRAVAFALNPQTFSITAGLERVAGWFILGAFVATALAPLVALQRKLTVGRGSHAVPPSPGARAPTPPAPAGWN